MIYKFVLFTFFCPILLFADLQEVGTIILGRPTDNSITFSVLAKTHLEFYIEYDSKNISYRFKSETYKSVFPEPVEFKITDLISNTKYFYRIVYRTNDNESYNYSEQMYFHTQREKGEDFTFTIQSDSHLYDKKGSSGLMKITINNQIKDSADFVFDLGDTFGDDHEPFSITNDEIKQLRLNFLPFVSPLAMRSPLFLCLGNHEGESGYYLLQDPPNNIAIYSTIWRKKYFPNPYPDNFYTGNDDVEPFEIGNPQNYYAFEWGDALFVVLDVYRYYTANEKPNKWDWTIGDEQYFWLNYTLKNSQAKFKFVFAHHTLGQGRGAASESMLYEWGGFEDDNKNKWTFDVNRPYWAKPIHQLMVDNGVQIYFQGHDHLYSKEIVDGVVYQEVPMPSDSTYKIGVTDNGDAYTGLTIGGSGHLRVRVSNDKVNVDYINSVLPKDETTENYNGQILHTYTVYPTTSSILQSKVSNFLLLSPNPASDYIEINLSTTNPRVNPWVDNSIGSDIKIYNTFGEYVLNVEMKKFSSLQRIDISHLPIGLYFIQFGNVTEKFVVAR